MGTIGIKELQKEFTKNKEVFTQIGYNPETEVYIYKRTFPSGAVVYEVFKRKINTQYNCVSYPGNEAFGFWALTFPKYDLALPHMKYGLKYDQAHFKVKENKNTPRVEQHLI